MDTSGPQAQTTEAVTGAAQIAYAAPTYQATASAVTGASQTLPSFPTSPAHLSGQHQLAYQQVQQFQQQQQQQQLQTFWSNQILEIEQTTDFKNHSLPLARIKKIMKSDEDVRMISAEAPVVFAKACEMFILELTLRSWINTEENKRRTLQKNDIAAAITRTDIFDFLVDIVPRDELKEEGLGITRAGLPAVGGPADAISYYYFPAQNQMHVPGMMMGKLADQTGTTAGGAIYAPPPHPMAYVSWPQAQMQSSQPPQQQPAPQQTDV